MVLDAEIKEQLKQYLQLMKCDVLLKVSAGSDDVSSDMLALVNELASMSPRIRVEETSLPRTPSFSVNRVGEDTGVTFAGIPWGMSLLRWYLRCCKSAGARRSLIRM